MMTSAAAGPPVSGTLAPLPDCDRIIAPYLDAALAALDGPAPLLAGMARYHLGLVDAALEPLPPGGADRGKRIRPAVALLAAGAVGGDPATAAPLGAALELLHNFTLVHDDVQDESPTRRHRATVWRLWGIGQAINAGDALFAVAHLPLHHLVEVGADPRLTLRLLDAFDRMTVAIVQGQTLDLGFEGRSDVAPDDYLRTIEGKTAAIVRYAAWAGALLGGADEQRAERFAAFGLALGIGFQIRDDALGIWGAPEETGKAPADDIRRRKQSLPILLLRQRLDDAGRAELDALYAAPVVDATGVARVLELLDAAGVRHAIAAQVADHHDRARADLDAAAVPGPNPARDRLRALVDRLADRAG
ncbi:MAG: polyprenyl synthetase family protein [Thermomicrobiales bacterium]|nr:polyprenyl synthetase family protein [Thermomicrobiales bacterium]